MKAWLAMRGAALTKCGWILATCLALAIGAFGARRMLADEAMQAQAFVDEGRRDLAKNDRVGAILAVERARSLAPRDPTVRAALADLRVDDPQPLLRRGVALVTAREWSAIAATSGWFVGLGVAWIVLGRKSPRVRRLTLAMASVFVVAMIALVDSASFPRDIVMASGARLLVAPYATANVEAPLAAGAIVTASATYDDFVRVELGDGTHGWLSRRSVEPIAAGGT